MLDTAALLQSFSCVNTVVHYLRTVSATAIIAIFLICTSCGNYGKFQAESFRFLASPVIGLHINSIHKPSLSFLATRPRYTCLHSYLPSQSLSSERVQRIKNLSLKRQILNDITASEFALQVELKTESRTIDFEKLIAKLQESLELVKSRDIISKDSILLDRILKTKNDLELARNGVTPQIAGEKIRQGSDRVKELQETLDIRLIVREDGTVDWDGAIASGKEVAKFGAELAMRLNGKEEGIPTFAEFFGQVQAKEPETPAIIKLSSYLEKGKSLLDAELQAKNQLSDKLRNQRKSEHAIESSDILLLRRLDLRVKELEKWVKLLKLDIDLERICVSLEQEIETCIDPNEPRQFIAEATLVDKQYSSIIAGIKLPDLETLEKFDESAIADVVGSQISLIDDDELNLVVGEVNELMNRLGLATKLPSSIDWGTLGKLASESAVKIRTGFAFFTEGIKLLLSDLDYARKLLLKAVQGYTLKPREVNTLRRTGKDLLTLIPVTIIMIIPLTPVGHVLVFSFIQRFLPDFFPTPFTEQRVNLKKLFSEIEQKKNGDIDDILGEEKATAVSWPTKLAISAAGILVVAYGLLEL